MIENEEISSNSRRAGVTLEQLLQLKRAERPAPEFWEHFERDLREKQLVALMRREDSFWLRVRRAFALPGVWAVPAGLAAVAAVSVVALRDPTVVPQAAPVAESELAAVEMVHTMEVASDPIEIAEPIPVLQAAPAPALAEVRAAATERLSPSEIARMVPWVDTGGSPAIQAFASVRPEVVLMASDVPALEAAADPVVESTEPSQVVRRILEAQALLGTYVADQTTAGPSAERVGRYVGDSSYRDGFSRLGMTAHTLSIKF